MDKFTATDVAMYIFWHHSLDKDMVAMAVKMFYDDATVDLMPSTTEETAQLILDTPKYWADK